MSFLKIKNRTFNLELFFIVLLVLISIVVWVVIFFPEVFFKNEPENTLNQFNTRKPVVANLFYPADKEKLSYQIQDLISNAEKRQYDDKLKAIIVPHASIGYSGITASKAYAQIINLKNQIKRAVIIAPAHHGNFYGIALSSAQKWQMPFVDFKIDQPTNKALLDLPFVQSLDAPHKNEHSIEVQLPFIYETLGNISIIPALVGDITADDMELFINKALRNPETLLIICSNLSYNLDYFEGKQVDIKTTKAILDYDTNKLNAQNANGHLAIKGLLTLAKQRGYKTKNLDLRSSGDVHIRRDKVIGYASFAIYEPKENPLIAEKRILDNITKKYGETLIKVAFDSIMNGFETGKPLIVNLNDYPEELRNLGVSFVTINKSGAVRGAMGSLIPRDSLLQDVATNAFLAAFYDKNFNPINKNEISFISLKISLLTPPYPLSFITEQEFLNSIEQNESGVILKDNNKKTSLLLPDAWDFIRNKKMFLAELKRQAKLDIFYWSPSMTASKFLTSSANQKDYSNLNHLWKNY